MICTLNNKDEFDAKLKEAGSQLVVIDFYAEWCMPCTNLSKWYNELPNQYPDVIFCKVNTDDAEDLVEEFSIRSIPHILLFKDGNMIKGVNNKEELKKQIESLKCAQSFSETK
ncbi:thioredoxin-like [Stegostoma tigrinum]|uniref:thioredoxin-like n=1 Tax=Stegostoma tigrinum TaxID=3053191 RepID=UPI00202B8857|nr:thioredoxin-like [Stegostoma tigrinum]